MAEAVKFSDDEMLNVKLEIKTDSTISISAESEKGEYGQSLSIETNDYWSDFKPSSFQGKWLSDFAALCVDSLTIGWKDPEYAIRIDARAKDGTKLLYVQMPLRTP